MKITTLIENTRLNEDLIKEHGLSLLIETGDKKILFDSGQSGSFADNAKRLGIDLKEIDYAILSHGHYDHGGGMLRFLNENKKAKIYMNKNVFDRHFHGKTKDIGLNPDLKESDRIIYTDDQLTLSDGITLYTCNTKTPEYPLETFGLYTEENGEFMPEDFKHEHYLEIIEDGKKILFSGCSHKGILNIMNWLKPDILIGGFHFMEIEMDDNGQRKLKSAADELMTYQTLYYTGHCTGKKQYAYLKEIMGEQLENLSTGKSIEI